MKRRFIGLGMCSLTLSAVSGQYRSPQVPIAAIQGASHVSPLLGQRVGTEGIVTAATATGFYLQDPAGDGDPSTSEGIFIEAQDRAPVQVGDRVRVQATVAEAASPGSPEGLRITRLVQPSAIRVISRANSLPPSVVLGAGGRSIPRVALIAAAELPTDLRDPAQARRNRFNPSSDALDFFEALEGMLVTLRNPTALSPTEERGQGRADYFATLDAGSPTWAHARTAAGGILLRSGPDNRGDQNLDRLRVAFDPVVYRDSAPVLAAGDRAESVTGVLDYAYGAFQVIPVARVRMTRRSRWRPEATPLTKAPGDLAIATYNVLNLSADSSDDRQRQRLAEQIVRALRSPDIVALQEIQDSSGERDDGVVDAGPTLRKLVHAIHQTGGPNYAYVDVAPANGRPGGAPGGNIRNAFIYDTARVRLRSFRSITPEVLAGTGAGEPAAFRESRDPLEGVFEFNGRPIIVINNHLTSRYGSTPVFGAVQPWVQAGETEREAQVRALRGYVGRLVARDASAQVVVLGDMNTFDFSDDLTTILPGEPPLLTNLLSRVELTQRYSYIFEGNSQALDHIFVTANLAALAEIDLVHLNVDFPSAVPASDHDPVVAKLRW